MKSVRQNKEPQFLIKAFGNQPMPNSWFFWGYRRAGTIVPVESSLPFQLLTVPGRRESGEWESPGSVSC